MTEKKHIEHESKAPAHKPEPVHEVKAAKPEPAPVDPAAPEGKTIQSITLRRAGSMHVVDLLFTDGSQYFIKERHGVFEIGGTAEWDTGRIPAGQ